MKNVLKWYSGKALEKATAAVALVEASLAEGNWVPNASRTVAAILSKANVAQSMLKKEQKKVDWRLRGQNYKGGPSGHNRFHIDMAIRFGSRPQDVSLDLLEQDPIVQNSKEFIKEFLTDFIPFYNTVQMLNATRPKPIFTKIGVSPTITKTLEDVGLNLDISTIRVCPMRFDKYVYTDPVTGKEETRFICVLLWPRGTQFDTSRFSKHSQCQSCGHGIKDPYNWTPLIIDSADGTPHAFWVGKDCAKRVFGIEMTGKLEIKGGRG